MPHTGWIVRQPNDLPHPHLAAALGFSKVKPEPSKLSTKFTRMPAMRGWEFGFT